MILLLPLRRESSNGATSASSKVQQLVVPIVVTVGSTGFAANLANDDADSVGLPIVVRPPFKGVQLFGKADVMSAAAFLTEYLEQQQFQARDMSLVKQSLTESVAEHDDVVELSAQYGVGLRRLKVRHLSVREPLRLLNVSRLSIMCDFQHDAGLQAHLLQSRNGRGRVKVDVSEVEFRQLCHFGEHNMPLLHIIR